MKNPTQKPSKQRLGKTMQKNTSKSQKSSKVGVPLGTQKGATNHVFASLLLSQAVLGAKVAPKPPPRASGIPPSFDFVCFWVNFCYIFGIICPSSWITFGLVFRSVCSSSRRASKQGKQDNGGNHGSKTQGKQASMQAGQQARKQAGKQAEEQASKLAGMQEAGMQVSKPAGRQSSRQAGTQSSRQANRQHYFTARWREGRRQVVYVNYIFTAFLTKSVVL